MNSQRFIELEGALNVRDLGGYDTNHGKPTTWGRVFRADSLHKLTAADELKLRDLGLRAIIDLRRQDEIDVEPDLWMTDPTIRFHHLPINEVAVSSAISVQKYDIHDLTELYRSFLDVRQPQLKRIFTAIVEVSDQPLVFHCSAGKDRTGIIAALLLDLAGVPAETIAQDYELTRDRITSLLSKYRERAVREGFDLTRHERMLECQYETMLDTVGYLHDTYNGADNYLSQIGLTRDQVDRLHWLMEG